ncbi:hypothetical protein HMPREF9003_2257 [Bifidobacterium dentium JCVIHMP022]|nr:hypothetical protein HMPREF9003_2257 [Bifidobacterium dentium JCVIHMP022]
MNGNAAELGMAANMLAANMLKTFMLEGGFDLDDWKRHGGC